MTRTDIYNASKNIFSELPEEEVFAADMADNEKASQAFNSIIENKDKYEEMGVKLPETVEEFQAIVTTDPKKKSTNTGSNGSSQTQQSSGSKPAQSSQQGPKVFQPQRVFNSIQEIDNYFGYLEGYKNDPAAKAEKQWFDENYANITDEFWKQGGKPLTVQGPPVKQQKTASVNYQSNLPKVGKKSTIDNKQFLREEQKKVIPQMTEEELMGQVINETTPVQDVMQAPLNIQQAVVQSEKQAKREEEGAKVAGMSASQIIDQQKKEDQKADLKNFYDANYPKIESLINNGFGTRSNDIDFSKLNVNNRSELEDAYGKLEQDYLEYLQKTDPQEYERVNNEIKGIRSKKGSDINTGERQVIDGFRAKAMDMHNLVNGYVMHEIEKNYDLPAYFGAASAMSIQIDTLDKQIQALNIDPSGKGVSPSKSQQYQNLVDQRNKLTTEYNGLDEKFGIPTEVVAKYQDVANRYLDNGVVKNQLANLDTELAAKNAEKMKAAQQRFDEAMSGDYSVAGEGARTFTNTVGRAAVDLVTSAWDVIGEASGDTDYDIWDQIANFGRGYNFEKEKMFGTAQDFSPEQREYSDLPLGYRMTGLTGSALGSISLSAAGAVLTGGLGLGQTVGGGMLMLGSSLSDNYNEALSNGYSGKEAANYAATMAGVEFAVESLFPDFEFFKTTEGKKQLLRAVVNSKTPKEAFEKLMVGLPENVMKEFKTMGSAIVKEGPIEEGGSQFISDIVKSKFNEQNKDKGQFEVFKGQDYLDSVVGGSLGAASASIIGRLGSPKMPHEESWVFLAATNPDILALAERNAIIVPDEMKEVIAVSKDIDQAMKSKPGYSNLSDDQKAHVVSEIQRMKYLEEQNKKVGIDDKATQEEIANIKSEVDQILTNSINKTKENAVQERSAEEVLPRKQGTTSETGSQPQGMGQSVQGQEATQEGEKVSQEGVVSAGKKLFNEPNPETAQISDEYKKAKGIEEGPGSNITKLDTDRAMKIADAYDQMPDTPNDPEVQKAYQKLADETLDQFNAITDKGYTVELWEGEGEPYANSEEMIKDLKDNKHMYIFSTEKGFGDNPITDEQRKQNKLLEDSKFKDKNGKPLLFNDLFRFVHDFFGHSERGNGFGPVGEENAWDVHARMYTPLARRAMTTETRGQNSWVNFGPQMRNEDGSLKKPSDPGYLKATERRFADQKMGLLPEEFSQIEEAPVQDQEVDKKSIADKIRGLKSKGGKLYSAGLGIPVAIWDGAVEIIATAVEAGDGLINGINKAKKYLQEKLKDKYNEDLVDELLDNVINQSPVQIQSTLLKGDKVKVNPEGHNLSFVKPEDLIDIESLIKDIESKNEKVWFWVADQLGRGIYADKTTGNEHFLDAGPSYALDPKNRDQGIIWASGMPSSKIEENIKNSDYIFIISGSPTQSKLFNKAVFKLFEDKLGDYKKFKSEVLNAKTTKGIREVLNAHSSWNTLIEDPSTDNLKLKKVGTGRKKFLIELLNAFDKPNSGLHQILKSRDALLDINSIRDGFYADNNFDVNDIMLVLKPEQLGGKSQHSTYENDILGQVIGVPDKKIDAYNILPNSLRKESETNKSLQTSRVAPYGSGIREVSATESIERETKNKAEAIRASKLNEAVEMISDAQETGGSEVIKAQKEVAEKLGEEGKKIAEIDRNFDKLADELGFIKTCII